MVRIADVHPGTVAAELQLEIGSRIVRINGEPVRDAVDLRFLEVDERVEVEVTSACGGERLLYEIEKEAGEGLGILPAPDAVRQCANKCVFCFVDGNPAGARQALHLKDDDFRLSFTYGSYVTLTNLGPKGFQRLIDQRLSPLYVSVHATEAGVRERLLGVPRGGDIMAQLRRLTDAGLDVHTQVVLCPGWNDGDHLRRTIDDLWSLGEGILSLSIVPVGLTRYNLDRPVRLLTATEAGDAIRQVEDARRRAERERGMGWVYAGDELYFIAGEAVPEDGYYDDWPLTENGVGAVRALLNEFADGVGELPRLDGRRVAVVTGTRMAPVLAPLAARAAVVTGATIQVVPVQNDYFGPTVTTAGLLPGRDIRRALQATGRFDTALLPAEALNDDGRFADDLSLDELAAGLPDVRLERAHFLASGLGRL